MLPRLIRGIPARLASKQAWPFLRSTFSQFFTEIRFWTISETTLSMNIFWMEIRVKFAIFHDFFHGWDSCKFFTRNSSVDNFENYHISDYILNMNYRVNFLLFHDFWYFCYFPWLSMTTNFSMTFPDFPWQWEPCSSFLTSWDREKITSALNQKSVFPYISVLE